MVSSCYVVCECEPMLWIDDMRMMLLANNNVCMEESVRD